MEARGVKPEAGRTGRAPSCVDSGRCLPLMGLPPRSGLHYRRKTRAGKIDLRYGGEPRQRLDFFACGTPGAPTLAYIHGGYWQLNDKEPYAFFGETLLPAGFNLALLEYTRGEFWLESV